MAYSLSSNKCAKNLCKPIVLVQLIIKNVVTCFFGTQCSSGIGCRPIGTLKHDGPTASDGQNATISVSGYAFSGPSFSSHAFPVAPLYLYTRQLKSRAVI